MKPKTADDVSFLMDAYVTSAALNAAMELGLFWLLAGQPLEASEVAQTLDIPLNRCRLWLQFLATTGLIERGAQGYAPTPTAQSAILDASSQDAWAFLAEGARDRYPAILDLARRIREPGSTWEAQGLTPPDYFAQLVESPARARRFTRLLYEIHLPLAEALAECLDMSGVRRMMDLGGGSGVMSLALLRRWPDLTALVVDIANVCAAGREIAAEQVVEARLTFQAADFLQDELPTGFDLVLECDVSGFGEGVLRKVWAALEPGGQLVIVYQFAYEQGLAPATTHYPLRAFLASMENPDLSHWTVDEIQANLRAVGFRDISQRLLPQRGTQRWTQGWVLIEARK